jgi:DNA-binding protein H-NS
MDERKRESMIAYLRHRMEEFGISPDDLASAIAADTKVERYRSANGDSWSGEGPMPQWLKQAISAGQSLEHFELPPEPVSRPPVKQGPDWANDPFAGSPLARPNSR